MSHYFAAKNLEPHGYYDEKYAKEVEHHPEIVIDGPLQGDWLSQTVTNWIKDRGNLLSFLIQIGEHLILGRPFTQEGKLHPSIATQMSLS